VRRLLHWVLLLYAVAVSALATFCGLLVAAVATIPGLTPTEVAAAIAGLLDVLLGFAAGRVLSNLDDRNDR
jgi:hypothetical protein